MDQHQLAAKERVKEAKRANRRLRASGRIPAIVYGGGGEPSLVSLDDHDVEMILHGRGRSNAIFNLDLDGRREQTVIRDVQRHPVNSRIQHIDFLRVDMNRAIEMELPVHAVGGDPAGVRAGGVLEHVTRTIHVRCTPANLPPSIDADISQLNLNEAFLVSDLVVPESIEVLTESSTPLFSILPPAKGAEGEEGAAPSEPELIGGKKPADEES